MCLTPLVLCCLAALFEMPFLAYKQQLNYDEDPEDQNEGLHERRQRRRHMQTHNIQVRSMYNLYNGAGPSIIEE